MSLFEQLKVQYLENTLGNATISVIMWPAVSLVAVVPRFAFWSLQGNSPVDKEAEEDLMRPQLIDRIELQPSFIVDRDEIKDDAFVVFHKFIWLLPIAPPNMKSSSAIGLYVFATWLGNVL